MEIPVSQPLSRLINFSRELQLETRSSLPGAPRSDDSPSSSSPRWNRRFPAYHGDFSADPERISRRDSEHSRTAKSDSQDVDPLSVYLITRREGCPDQTQHQDPDFPQDHRKILIEFFVSLVEMQVGIVGQRSWLLVSTTPCFQSQFELESSSL